MHHKNEVNRSELPSLTHLMGFSRWPDDAVLNEKWLYCIETLPSAGLRLYCHIVATVTLPLRGQSWQPTTPTSPQRRPSHGKILAKVAIYEQIRNNSRKQMTAEHFSNLLTRSGSLLEFKRVLSHHGFRTYNLGIRLKPNPISFPTAEM